METQYTSKKENQQREIEELKLELEKKTSEHAKLSSAMNDLKAANDQLHVNTSPNLEFLVLSPYSLGCFV